MPGVFADKSLVITDAGDGQNVHVQDGPNGFLVPMALIDSYITGQPDPAPMYAANIAARLSLAGVVSIQSSPGVADTAALSTLNAASFKGY